MKKILLFKKSGVYYVGKTDVLPPPLSKEEEDYLCGLSEKGDLKARNKLIEHNLRLVVFLAKKYENTKVDLEDLVSIGSIGLIKGVNTFSKDNIVYSFVLPCYAANEAGTVSYLYNSVDFLYKTIGNFTLGQDYIINGTLYICIGLVEKNGLLVNTQLTYGEIKGEYE